MKILVSIAMVCSVVALAAASRPQVPDWKAWLDAQTSGFSGVVLVGRGDTVEVEAAFGAADPATNRRNLRDTRFNLGSVNKTFTAIAIAQLVQQGRLSLDDTLLKHLPDYPNRDAARKIRIRDLISHRSGVAQFMRADFGDVSVAAMAKQVAAEPQVFEPGARQEYSNGGYVVLGRVVELVSGKSYDAYVADHIYRPAGMNASGFFKTGDSLDRFALPIPTMPGMVLGGPRPGNPAGGGYSTAADMFRFARALGTGKLLDDRTTQYVLHGTFAEEPRWGHALREQMAGTRRFIGNGGGAPGVNAEFRFEPAGDSTVVVLSNIGPPSATNLLGTILGRLADGRF